MPSYKCLLLVPDGSNKELPWMREICYKPILFLITDKDTLIHKHEINRIFNEAVIREKRQEAVQFKK